MAEGEAVERAERALQGFGAGSTNRGSRTASHLTNAHNVVRMDSTQLSPDQLQRLRKKVELHRRWLCKLVKRMDTLGFDSGDRLHRAATEAALAIERPGTT